MQIHSVTRKTRALAALLTFATASFGQKRWDAPAVVTSYCSGCHGIDGNNRLPYIPKLAGLDVDYATRRMAAFKGRPGPPVDEVFDRVLSRSKQDLRASTHQERVNMRGVAHAVKSEQIKQALEWYAIQLRRQGHSGDKALVALGKSLFMNGLPEQRQFACMTCHGPDAQGNRKAPRLAGQNAEYIVGQLLRFRRAESNNEPEMLAVARALNPAQVRAAAAYLQSR